MKDVSKFLGDWTLTNELVRVSSRWVTLVGERWICDKGKELEYWRVEKVDSVIVLPIHRGQLLTAKPTFRPGVCRHTLDFPGGACLKEKPRRTSCRFSWNGNWAFPPMRFGKCRR